MVRVWERVLRCNTVRDLRTTLRPGLANCASSLIIMRPELIDLSPSPWSLKVSAQRLNSKKAFAIRTSSEESNEASLLQARWALHHHGIAYRRTSYTPGISELWLRWKLWSFLGRVTVPVLSTGS